MQPHAGQRVMHAGAPLDTARAVMIMVHGRNAAPENILELTFNHDGRSYDNGTGYGHIAIGVENLDGTLQQLAGQGIEPERPPYTVSDGGSRLCFVRDPDDYRVEIIGRK